ncbi:MAG: DUF3006 family protein [Gemmatimonadaceae bacterium]
MKGRVTLTVDRLEARVAVLIDDDGRELEVARRRLPKDARREGAVLRVDLDDDREPVWTTAVADHEEEQRRLADARERLERLRRSDPGGDIEL